jgi:hypothetical protein
MIEAIVSFSISLVLFAIGYGRLLERIDQVAKRLLEDERHNEEQMKSITTELKVVTDLRVDLAEIKKDIHYIKEKI